jgi:hypothetical protein
MRRFALMTAAFAAIASLGWSDPAEARHLRSRAGVHGSCRVPPWYRGLESVAPWVCADYWWSPRFYYQGMGVRDRRRY